jgi:4-amino-4-deoxy-L-arabinose transferase-like glycosyltransferase
MSEPEPLLPSTERGGPLGWRAAGLVFAAALAFRLAYLGKAMLDPSFFTPWLDARGYLQWAQAIAAGNHASPAVFFHAPLYPHWLALMLLLGRGDLVFVRVMQILLGAATAALVGALGARLFGRAAGVLAGLLCATTATLVVFDLELLSESLFVALCVVALLALERTTREPSSGWLFGLGLLLGLAAIARPTVLIFVPVAVLLCAGAARAHEWGWPKTLRGAGIVVLGAILPIVPVTLHNLLVGHDLVLISSQGGVNLFIGNNANADGHTAADLGPTDTPPYAKDGTFTDNIMSSARFLASEAVGRSLKPSEVSAFWFRRALAWIVGQPRAWAALTLRKVLYVTLGFEGGDNKNLTYLFDDWRPFAFMARWWWLFPLAVAGLSAPGARRGRLLLGSFAATYGIAIVGFIVIERFRLPLYPVLCVLAARFVVWSVAAARRRRWGSLAPRLALVGALLVWTNWNPTGYSESERIASRLARAEASEARRDFAEAERLYLAALEIDRLRPNARQAYGGFLVRQGRLGEARVYLGPASLPR